VTLTFDLSTVPRYSVGTIHYHHFEDGVTIHFLVIAHFMPAHYVTLWP